jgi:hypothetical protein
MGAIVGGGISQGRSKTLKFTTGFFQVCLVCNVCAIISHTLLFNIRNSGMFEIVEISSPLAWLRV